MKPKFESLTRFLLSAFLANALSVHAGELVSATCGPSGNSTKSTFQVTDEPLNYFDAWGTLGGFQVRQSNIEEAHIGFPDLLHSAVSQAYGRTSSERTRYFRKQTITSSWSSSTATHTNNGSFNFTVRNTPEGITLRDSISLQQESTAPWFKTDDFGNVIYSGILTRTSHYTFRPSQVGTPVYDGYVVTVYGGDRPDEISTTTGRSVQFSTQVGPNYATSEFFMRGTPSGVWAAPPDPWTESVASWQTFEGQVYKYTMTMSEEDTVADVESRIAQGRSLSSLEDVPWGKYRMIQNGEITFEGNGSTDNISVANLVGELGTTGNYSEQRAQVRFVVPEALRIPGAAYRGRVIEYFYSRGGGGVPQILKIHEVEMYEGKWESDIITPVIRSEDGVTFLRSFSTVAEIVRPHQLIALPPAAHTLTAPIEYVATKPIIGMEPQIIGLAGEAQVYRPAVANSHTLQQINLSDVQGSLNTWPAATATWSILSGSTAQVRLWGWTDDGSALGVWQTLSPGADLKPFYGSETKFVFAEATSAGNATVRITVTLNGQDINDDLIVTAGELQLSLAVDANRDGIIALPSADRNAPYSDETTATRPYRFWINDDDDVDDDDPEDSENAPISTVDFTDDKIDGIRDLEDFSGLKIYLGGLQQAVVRGQIRVGLKWKYPTGSPSLKVWRNLSPNGGTETLTNVAVARQHMALRRPGVVQGTTTYIIPTQFWQDADLSPSQPYGNLLFEGCTAGKGQLVILLHKADGTEIGEGPGTWIDLKNIKSMYERVKATAAGAENVPFPYNHVGSDPVPAPAMGWTPDPNGYPFEPAPAESSTYIVSVHGWNQTYERSTMYAETMFKRMWHRGYKGRFVRFRWPTFTGLTTYNDSEYRAWKCGVSLKQYLDTLPSTYTVNLVAHSMGNIVAGSALEKGASVANYALLNAAVPAICYDTSGNVVQTSWGYITPNDDPDSATVALTYQSRLANVSGNLVNFFLPADSALSAWELNNDSPSGGRFPLVGTKPHQWPEGSLETAGYRYQRTATAGQKLRVVRVAGERILASPDEAMGFAVQAPSLTVGADGRTRGSIDDWADMTAYGFDSVHSAEFLFTIHQTRDFYGTLLLKLGVAVQP